MNSRLVTDARLTLHLFESTVSSIGNLLEDSQPIFDKAKSSGDESTILKFRKQIHKLIDLRERVISIQDEMKTLLREY